MAKVWAGIVVAVGTALLVLSSATAPSGSDITKDALFRVAVGVLIVGAAVAFVALLRDAWRGIWNAFAFNLSHEDDRECIQSNDDHLQLRVKVSGRIKLQEVRLAITEREPWGQVDLLHLKNDNTSDHPRSLRGDRCSPGRPLYFDVAFHRRNGDEAKWVYLEYADDNLKNQCALPVTSDAQTHILTLEVTGKRDGEDGTVRAKQEVFRLDIDTNKSPEMTLLKLSTKQAKSIERPLAVVTYSGADAPETSGSAKLTHRGETEPQAP